ncbi:hypothetical protein ACVIGB_002040 [Bradyrhizobium sp. USDA 4341]
MTDEKVELPKPEIMAFADFLQTIPPGQSRLVRGLGTPAISKPGGIAEMYTQLMPPPLELHCEHCDGERHFRTQDADGIHVRDHGSLFFEYACSNCRTFRKTFSVHVEFTPLPNSAAAMFASSNKREATGRAYKYGEMPPFGVAVPNRLLKMMGNQRDNFLKGRRCENQGLGIAAFAYYRRCVESQKNEILDEMISVSRKQNASAETISTLEEAKRENQFSKAVSSVKLGLPDSILINTHNPLTLLHSALSAGVHEHTDEQCLEFAQAVRLVLVELAERLTRALKDEAELNTAVSKLLKAKEL